MTTSAPMTMTTEATPVLAQHRFDESRLEHYLRKHLPEFTPPLTVAQTLGVSQFGVREKYLFLMLATGYWLLATGYFFHADY